ncbi:hypothetical protein [Candidatus Williamhamiltonella defendens]|uniref:hypothetical protein n=1 Tax=Candidatus Williamhamiltonella defendens TaxID=138072 RepID=UPI00130E7FC0|nr:hypothetical protein [Candidatus Hamiltonella defensa]
MLYRQLDGSICTLSSSASGEGIKKIYYASCFSSVTKMTAIFGLIDASHAVKKTAQKNGQQA